MVEAKCKNIPDVFASHSICDTFNWINLDKSNLHLES